MKSKRERRRRTCQSSVYIFLNLTVQYNYIFGQMSWKIKRKKFEETLRYKIKLTREHHLEHFRNLVNLKLLKIHNIFWPNFQRPDPKRHPINTMHVNNTKAKNEILWYLFGIEINLLAASCCRPRPTHSTPDKPEHSDTNWEYQGMKILWNEIFPLKNVSLLKSEKFSNYLNNNSFGNFLQTRPSSGDRRLFEFT